MDKNDVIMLSEHWLHNNRLSLLNEASDEFHSFGRSSRVSFEESYGLRRGQGGVAIFWRKSLKGVSKIETVLHDRICGIRMECGDGSVIILLSVYMPASGSRDNLSVTLDELDAIIDSLEEGAIPIIGGDFNGNMGKKGGPRAVNVPTKAGIAVYEFSKRQNLVASNLLKSATGQVETYMGHNGSSLIDYIFIPEFLSNKVFKCHTGRGEPLNTSDHLPIELTVKVGTLPRTISITKLQNRLRWDKCNDDFIMNQYQEPISQKLYDVQLQLDRDNISNVEIDLSRTPTFETWTQTSNRPGLEMVQKRSVTGLRHSLQWSVTGL